VDLLEAIRQNFDAKTLTIFMVCVVAVVAAVIWLINKTTGRPVRDMVALAGACVVLLVFITVVMSMGPKDAAGERRTIPFSRTIILAIGAVVAWFFNKLVSARPRN